MSATTSLHVVLHRVLAHAMPTDKFALYMGSHCSNWWPGSCDCHKCESVWGVDATYFSYSIPLTPLPLKLSRAHSIAVQARFLL